MTTHKHYVVIYEGSEEQRYGRSTIIDEMSYGRRDQGEGTVL